MVVRFIAIQLGEAYCDFNGILIPHELSTMIGSAYDPFDDSKGMREMTSSLTTTPLPYIVTEFLSQLKIARRLIGDINRERVH